VPAGGLLSVAWVAFKVGALSYGGGFVIIPLMQHDAVHTYHWMTGAVPGRPRSAPSPAPRSRWRSPCPTCGNWPSWGWLRDG
jgi:hypothetical protein